MKISGLGRGRIPVLIISVFLACLLPTVHAFVKNISIVDENGNTLSNTKVTITFTDGSTVNEESGDEGMLIYDFPEDGDYAS